MNTTRVTARLTTVACAILCLALVFIIASCEKAEEPITPSAQQAPMTNDELALRALQKGVNPSVTPLDALACPADRYCGPMDVVFLIDNTGSMGGAINNVKSELTAILNCIESVSGGDYRMALLTFADDITILNNFADGNKASIETNITAITAGGGAGGPEASDEALNTVINALPVGGRPQNIDFTPDWRAGARKIIILVTDAPPGGFDDTYTVGVDDVNAHARALEAFGKDINISAIFVPTGGDYSGQVAIMMDYADETGGIYYMTESNGAGTGIAIIDIIGECGTATLEVPLDIKPGSCPNPFNIHDMGVLPVAVLGTEGFDVSTIDPATVMLNGVPALRWEMADVGTPYSGDLVDCMSCVGYGADGFMDLTLKFNVQALVGVLGEVTEGDCLPLTLTGKLLDGRDIEGMDIVRVQKVLKGKPTGGSGK